MDHVFGLPPLVFFAMCGGAAGAARLLRFGNGSSSKALGTFLAGILLGSIFGSAGYQVSAKYDSFQTIRVETGLLACLVAAVLAPVLMEWVLGVGGKSLSPIGAGIIRAAEWTGRKIGGSDPPPSPPPAPPANGS